MVIFVVCCLAKTRKRRLKPKGAEAAAGDFLAMDMVRIEYISLYIDECSLKELKSMGFLCLQKSQRVELDCRISKKFGTRVFLLEKKGKLEIKTHPQPSVYHPAGQWPGCQLLKS